MSSGMYFDIDSTLSIEVDYHLDWIAHGILDSIVDSFFPFLEEVEKEVMGVENVVFSDYEKGQVARPQTQVTTSRVSPETEIHVTNEKNDPAEKFCPSVDEKYQPPINRSVVKTRFFLPRPTIPLFIRRLRRTVLSLSVSLSVEFYKMAEDPTALTLRRMARTRRLVTSLTRLLATKSEVVAQIQKRLLTSSHSGLGNGAGKDDDVEVAIYMGDVQGIHVSLFVSRFSMVTCVTDHILTLQHSLAHYERMLSQSHPTYLSQLRVSVAATTSGSDKAVMILTIVSMLVLCGQVIIGEFVFTDV